MSGVRREPLTLEVTLAHYVATLPEGEVVGLRELAARFGCSVGEVRSAVEAVIEVEDRDLTVISGLYIEGEGEGATLVKSGAGGYERGFKSPVRLSAVQARAALLALDLVSGAADPVLLEGLRRKVRETAGEEVAEVGVGGRRGEDAGVVSALELARRESRVLEISYPSGPLKEPTLREVEPLLMSRIEGVWYLNAYCRVAEGARLFRLDRILSARATNARFEARGDVPLKTDFEDIDPRTYSTHRAVVRFSPAVARWMEERPELDFIQRYPDGSADYALYYTDPAWAARRVMQYLGEATVMEPEELREEVRLRAARLLLLEEYLKV